MCVWSVCSQSIRPHPGYRLTAQQCSTKHQLCTCTKTLVAQQLYHSPFENWNYSHVQQFSTVMRTIEHHILLYDLAILEQIENDKDQRKHHKTIVLLCGCHTTESSKSYTHTIRQCLHPHWRCSRIFSDLTPTQPPLIITLAYISCPKQLLYISFYFSSILVMQTLYTAQNLNHCIYSGTSPIWTSMEQLFSMCPHLMC